VSQKQTTFEMSGSHPLKSFLLDIYYAMHNFSLIGNDLGVPQRPDKLLHNMTNSRKLPISHKKPQICD